LDAKYILPRFGRIASPWGKMYLIHMDIPLNANISRNPAIAWRMLDGNLVAITPKDSTIHRINKTGAFIWNMLTSSGKSVRNIIDAVAREYGLTDAEATADVIPFLKKARQKNIVIVA